ncbi:MAG: hypothetical protein H5U40_15920 [Polyangiaceae bacterium]|nr:hypothetical protein [Polyangiaceae bacterium]
MGWIQGCATSDDPAQLDRCMLYVSEGALVQRCGTGAPVSLPSDSPAESAASPSAAGAEG